MSREISLLLEDVKVLKPYLSKMQLDVLFSNAKRAEDKDYFIGLIDELKERISTSPVTYQQDGVKDPIAHFHYFNGGSDWYITELDMDGGVQQAFGYAILNGNMQDAELGYISITELVKYGCELDFHFKPTPLSIIKEKAIKNDESLAQREMTQATSQMMSFS